MSIFTLTCICGKFISYRCFYDGYLINRTITLYT